MEALLLGFIKIIHHVRHRSCRCGAQEFGSSNCDMSELHSCLSSGFDAVSCRGFLEVAQRQYRSTGSILFPCTVLLPSAGWVADVRGYDLSFTAADIRLRRRLYRRAAGCQNISKQGNTNRIGPSRLLARMRSCAPYTAGQSRRLLALQNFQRTVSAKIKLRTIAEKCFIDVRFRAAASRFPSRCQQR